ncbi:hypothetical protein [Lacticaseibacillus suihuaensis]
MEALNEAVAQKRLAQLGGPVNLVRPVQAAQLATYWTAIGIGMPTTTAVSATFSEADALLTVRPAVAVTGASDASAAVTPATSGSAPAGGPATPGTARSRVFGATTSGRAIAGVQSSNAVANGAAVGELVTAAAAAGATGWLLQDEGRAGLLIHQAAADLLIVCSQLVCRSADCHCG